MNFEHIKEELREIWQAIHKIQTKQETYVQEHHKLEKEFIEMKTDLKHVRGTLDSMNSNINKLLFIVAGGFIAAIIGFIVKGGLV